jgi:predicted RNase H-like HicB family nuclease
MNKYSINIFWSEEDEGYIALSPEFPGLSAFGETPEKATAEARKVLKLFIDSYVEKGLALPEPQIAESYSGQTRLRLPKSLHRQAAQIAESDGISLNQFLADAVRARVTGEQISRHLLDEVRQVIQAEASKGKLALKGRTPRRTLGLVC